VYIDGKILEYIVRLGRATRDPGSVGRADLREMLQLGISPRSYQHLLALSRVTAFLHGRTWALPEDVKEIFCDATRHRIARTVRAQAENVDADAILQDLLTAVPIP
jgi:MoxR-like ATPase